VLAGHPGREKELTALRRVLDGLEGQWLHHLAILDARGAAGADHGVQAASTASWLRNRLRMSASAAQRPESRDEHRADT
jgi:hypothetical protein